MRALVYTRPGLVEVLDVADPAPADGETVLEVKASGICGSELHGIARPGFRRPPLVMGHEFAGVTPDGQRVTVNPILSCGACDRCGDGQENVCRDRRILGIHRAGAFAERVSVPERALHEIPSDITDEAAAMAEPLANAVHAWRLAAARPGARVGVIGAGTIGLLCALVARRHGARPVAVADLAEQRVRLARELGLDAEAGPLPGEYDVVIDAVGTAGTHTASVDLLRPGGTAVWVGLQSTDAAFDATALVRAEKTVRGSFAYTDREFAEALALTREIDLSWARVFPLEQGAQVFTELMNGRSDVVKALLSPGGVA